MKVSFRQLQYVRKAGACRNMARAAEELHISQSSVRDAIDHVEHEFGVRVFVRQPSKGLTPTQSGRQLLELIGGLLSEVEDFASQASGMKNTLAGELSVGCYAPLAPHALPFIIRDLTRRHPDVSVRLHEGPLPQVRRALIEGTVDVILTYDYGMSDQIRSEVLGESPPHVLLSADDPLAKCNEISLMDLREKPMVLLDLPETRVFVHALFESVGIRPTIAHRTESLEMVRSLVAVGLGFSILNLRPAIDQAYDGNRVVCVPISDPVKAPKFILGQRRHDFPTRLFDAFAESCRNFFQSPQAAQLTVAK